MTKLDEELVDEIGRRLEENRNVGEYHSVGAGGSGRKTLNGCKVLAGEGEIKDFEELTRKYATAMWRPVPMCSRKGQIFAVESRVEARGYAPSGGNGTN